VVISTWQSVFKQNEKYFQQFGAVVGDEAHLFKAKSLTSIMT
jgi:superfamily II DNA or RNA helicase